jgi:hypothetical protein
MGIQGKAYTNDGDRYIATTNRLKSEGAATGTALFFQSGQFLLIGGPVTLLLAYVWVSTVAYSMLVHPHYTDHRLIPRLPWVR